MFAESVSIWASVNSWFTPTTFFVVLNLMIGTIFITSTLAAPPATAAHDGHGRPRPNLARSASMLQRIKSVSFYSPRSQEPTTVFADPQPQFFNSRLESTVAGAVPGDSQLARAPSMSQRIKSVSFKSSRSQEPTSVFDDPRSQFFNSHLESSGAAAVPGDSPPETEESVAEDLGPRFEEVKGHVSRSLSDTKPTMGEIPTKLPAKMRKSASLKSAFSHFEEESVEPRRPETARERRVTEAEADDEVDAKADDFINKFKHQLKLQRIDSIARYKEIIGRGSIEK